VRGVPGSLGLRLWRVFVDVGSWDAAGHIGDGVEQVTSVEILEGGYPPKVSMVGEQRAALGFAEIADIEIGPITPEAGTAYSVLNGFALNPNQTLRLRLEHTDNAGDMVECVARRVEVDAALRISILAKPIR
jgi:hypothetical protein